MSEEFFVMYLHQNYLDFYSDIDDTVRATEYLSDSDYLSHNWTV